MARRRSGAGRGRGLRFTFGAIAALGLTLAAALVILRFGGAGNEAGDDVTAAGVRAGSGPAAVVDRFFKRIGDAWDSTNRIEALERENQQLRAWRDTALALGERMERYESLLKMPPDAYGRGTDVAGAVSARLVLDPAGSFKRTLLANAGADQGVHVGYFAVNEHGLVGRVVTLGKRSSRVLLLDDFNSRVPVMGLQSRVRAVLAGDASARPSLDVGRLAIEAPRLDYQAPEGALREGERIVTSGDGGVFPRGLPVGVATRGADGVWRVALAATARPIDYVRLLPYVNVPRPEAEQVAEAGIPGGRTGASAPLTALSEPARITVDPAGAARPPRQRLIRSPTPHVPDDGDDAPPAPDPIVPADVFTPAPPAPPG